MIYCFYSICKKCQKLKVYEFRQKEKELKFIEEEKIIDPDSKIKKITERTLLNLPIAEGKPLKDILKKSIKELSEISETSHIFKVKKDVINSNFHQQDIKIINIEKEYDKLYKYCKEMEKDIIFIKQELKEQSNLNKKLIGRLEYLEKIEEEYYINKLKNESNGK